MLTCFFRSVVLLGHLFLSTTIPDRSRATRQAREAVLAPLILGCRYLRDANGRHRQIIGHTRGARLLPKLLVARLGEDETEQNLKIKNPPPPSIILEEDFAPVPL